MIPADALRIYQPSQLMMRLGKENDGGYVVAVATQFDHFLSGGISNDNSFERHALQMWPHLTCYAYDPDSDGATPHDRYLFRRERVGYEGLDRCHNALVKLDIERAEWPWLKGLPHMWARNIAQIVIELHSPHVPESGWDWGELARLSETHALIHAHANNFDGIVDAGGTRCPGTLETTWLRWDIAGHLPRRRSPIPLPIDQVNDPSKADHVVDWEPFVEVVT
jgi:hypothetical protein